MPCKLFSVEHQSFAATVDGSRRIDPYLTKHTQKPHVAWLQQTPSWNIDA